MNASPVTIRCAKGVLMSDLATSLERYGAAVERTPAKMGRPSIMKPEIVEEIVERLATGEPLAKICRDARMPSYATVRRWERENSDFQAHSAPARDDGRAYMMDECKDIADDPALDPQDKRIRIETRMRLAGQWARSQVDVTSAGQAIQPAPVVFAAVFPPNRDGEAE